MNKIFDIFSTNWTKKHNFIEFTVWWDMIKHVEIKYNKIDKLHIILNNYVSPLKERLFSTFVNIAG